VVEGCADILASWDLGFHPTSLFSVPAILCHQCMTGGDARKVVPFVIEPFSEAESKEKMTASNGGKRKWGENLPSSPHPTNERDAASAHSVKRRVV
jgi:hypothetical protein